MEQTIQFLKKRQQQLLKFKKEKEKALMRVPEGTLRISNNKNHPQYYHRQGPKDLKGTYIKAEEYHLARRLAQKDYDRKVLRFIEKELKAIEKFFNHYPSLNPEQIYESLHPERQKLIIPIRETDEQFIQNWQSVEYTGKGFKADAPELYTAKGERVRSKSEVMIADLLNKENIPYRYEYPVELKGIGKVYPDFLLLHVKKREEIYYEHFGMMDDEEYTEKAMRKIMLYEQNGIFLGEKLIVTFETKKSPLNQKSVRRMLDHYMK